MAKRTGSPDTIGRKAAQKAINDLMEGFNSVMDIVEKTTSDKQRQLGMHVARILVRQALTIASEAGMKEQNAIAAILSKL